MRTHVALVRPVRLLAALVALVLTAGAATVAACNVHEIGHAATATLLGWEVERVNLCLPSGGSVEYAHVGRWAGNLQGYAGGLLAAVFLAGIYLVVFARRERHLRGPAWWAAGLGLALPVGPQVVNGLLEGMVRPGEDYTVRYSSLLPWLVVLSLAATALVYMWRWPLWRSS